MSISANIRSSLEKGSWIRKMFEEGNQLAKIHGAENVFDFTLGNPDVEPSSEFRERLRYFANNPIPNMHKYMSNPGYPETRLAIAKHLNSLSGRQLNENHVIMAVGAGGALNVTFKALLDPQDEVIVSAPYFVEYGSYVANHLGILKVVQSDNDFQLNIDNIAAAINEKTKAILINSPNNPTGVVYTEETLQKLAALIKQKEAELGKTIYLISDEPYAGLVYDNTKVPSVLGIFDHSIIVTSHSKDLAIPGERIGYVAINPTNPEPQLLFDALVYATRVLGFVNAPALMQHVIATLQGQVVGVESYKERRDIMYNHLVSIGFEVVKPQGAFYLFPKSPLADDVEFIRAAAKHNVLLVPGSGFGKPGFFRIAYCVSKDTIERSLPKFTLIAKEFGLTK